MNPFGDMADFFGQADKVGGFESFFSAAAPQAKKCDTQAELALWFRRFAWACRASLPKDKG